MKSIVTLLCVLCISTAGLAQQETKIEKSEPEINELKKEVAKLNRFKLSGYVQGQYQWGEENASLKVGSSNSNQEEAFSRIGIRRGRIKFTYEEGIGSAVFQLDLTEKGIGFKDAYLNLKDPWLKTNALRAGIFDRPFGSEIGYSSSKRESPERSTIIQTLFPEERDLGVMLLLQAAKTSPIHFLKLEAGLFAGNGIKQETDNRKDFIGHLSAAKTIGKVVEVGGGISYYNGSVYQGTENVYRMKGNKFVLDANEANIGKFAKREYLGIDAQFALNNALGKTQVRAEYLFGKQPGTKSGSKSPNASSLPTTDTYLRQFQGGYVVFVQNLGRSPLAAVLKYDWYDPNDKVSGNNVGLNNTDQGDLAQNTFGFGMVWHMNQSIRLQAFYELNHNEKTDNIDAYKKDLKNDVFTLRLQYKF